MTPVRLSAAAEMAKRQGQCMNLKKVYRLYSEEGLAVRRRRGRKRAIGTRAPLHRAHRPNQIWVLDFVSDRWRRAALPGVQCGGPAHP